MVERIEGLPPNVIGCRTSGTVTREDHERLIGPAIEQARCSGAKIRLLFQLDHRVDGFDTSGLWGEAMMGAQTLSVFERIAVVADVDWLHTAVRMFGRALPCEVRAFRQAEFDEARAWIVE